MYYGLVLVVDTVTLFESLLKLRTHGAGPHIPYLLFKIETCHHKAWKQNSTLLI